MPKNERISELFDQEFNKEKNYQAIMQKFEEYKKTHDLEEERRKYKRNLYIKVTASSLAVILIAVASIVLINQNPSGSTELEGDGNSTQTEVEDKIVINDFTDIKPSKIDTEKIWSENVIKNPSLDGSEFSNYNDLELEHYNFRKELVFGNYINDSIAEIAIQYFNENNVKIIVDVSFIDVNLRYTRYRYENNLSNEISEAENSLINNKEVKILHLKDRYLAVFDKKDFIVDMVFDDTLPFEQIKELIKQIIIK